MSDGKRLKLLVDPVYWARGPDRYWNYFDCFLMISGTLQIILKIKSAGAYALRVLRAGRIMRIAPIIKTKPFFKELRQMLNGVGACLRGLLWAGVLLTVVMYLFGIVFLGAVTTYIQDNREDTEAAEEMRLYFGSVPITLKSLFMAISGGSDWTTVSDPLERIWTGYGLIFISYIWVVCYGMMNVMTGVFVDMAMNAAQKDAQSIREQEDKETKKMMQDARELFREYAGAEKKSQGPNGLLYLSVTSFEEHIEAPAVVGYFEALGMDTEEALEFFTHLAEDDGRVNIDTFMRACLKLLRAEAAGGESGKMIRLLHATRHLARKQEAAVKDLGHWRRTSERSLPA